MLFLDGCIIHAAEFLTSVFINLNEKFMKFLCHTKRLPLATLQAQQMFVVESEVSENTCHGI